MMISIRSPRGKDLRWTDSDAFLTSRTKVEVYSHNLSVNLSFCVFWQLPNWMAFMVTYFYPSFSEVLVDWHKVFSTKVPFREFGNLTYANSIRGLILILTLHRRFLMMNITSTMPANTTMEICKIVVNDNCTEVVVVVVVVIVLVE